MDCHSGSKIGVGAGNIGRVLVDGDDYRAVDHNQRCSNRPAAGPHANKRLQKYYSGAWFWGIDLADRRLCLTVAARRPTVLSPAEINALRDSWEILKVDIISELTSRLDVD